MLRTSEYVSQLELSAADVDKMIDAQLAILNNGFKMTNKDSLTTKLGTVAGILSLVFLLPTPVALAAGVTSMIASNESQRSMCINLCNNGIVGLVKIQSYFRNNPSVKRMRVKFPFLQFADTANQFATFRIVQGDGLIVEIYDGKVWH